MACVLAKREDNLSLPDLVGRDDVFGYVNGSKMRVYVHSDDQQERIEEYNELKHERISSFLRETREGFTLLCYELGTRDLSEFEFHNHKFDQSKLIVLQILQGVRWLHSKGYCHTKLKSSSSYIFDQQSDSNYVSVKLDISSCCKRKYPDDFMDVAVFLSAFFRSGIDDWGENLPRGNERFVPTEVLPLPTGQSVLVKAYVKELNHLLHSVFHGLDYVNHPFFWCAERRMKFIQDLFEAAPKNTGLVAAIRDIPIQQEAGYQWENLNIGVCRDLRIDRLGGFRVSPHRLLRGLRQFLVNVVPVPRKKRRGLRTYRAYDKDQTRGLDMYLALRLPTFFISLYEAAISHLSGETVFDKYTDLSFDCEKWEKPREESVLEEEYLEEALSDDEYLKTDDEHDWKGVWEEQDWHEHIWDNSGFCSSYVESETSEG